MLGFCGVRVWIRTSTICMPNVHRGEVVRRPSRVLIKLRQCGDVRWASRRPLEAKLLMSPCQHVGGKLFPASSTTAEWQRVLVNVLKSRWPTLRVLPSWLQLGYNKCASYSVKHQFPKKSRAPGCNGKGIGFLSILPSGVEERSFAHARKTWTLQTTHTVRSQPHWDGLCCATQTVVASWSCSLYLQKLVLQH